MSKKTENIGFVCETCGEWVPPLSNGSYRNHCPYCLHSKHMDHIPGDRKSTCKGVMQPVGQKLHSKKGLQLIHLCTSCGHKSVNKTADDNIGDDFDKILALPAM